MELTIARSPFFMAEERKWLFLPRKASERTPYDERTDEFLASNLLLTADEDFSNVEVSPTTCPRLLL
jgi:hypothetical protein